jgi:hypothetical protein
MFSFDRGQRRLWIFKWWPSLASSLDAARRERDVVQIRVGRKTEEMTN